MPRTPAQIYLDGGGDPHNERAMALLAEAGRGDDRRIGLYVPTEYPPNAPAHPRPRFASAPLGRYLDWLRGYIEAGGAPTHYYDYPYSGFYTASGDFTTGGECGVSASNVLVPEGIRHLGGVPEARIPMTPGCDDAARRRRVLRNW